MKHVAVFGAYALVMMSCIWAGAFLIVAGHEWWSILPFAALFLAKAKT